MDGIVWTNCVSTAQIAHCEMQLVLRRFSNHGGQEHTERRLSFGACERVVSRRWEIKVSHSCSQEKASFSKNGVIISNPVDIANNFCDYFTNIGPNSSPNDFLCRSLSESISLQPLTVDELSNIVKSFSHKMASGRDNDYFHENNSSVSSKYCSTPCIDN